ncbi:unnamed protein product [Sphacelaria rigidula]
MTIMKSYPDLRDTPDHPRKAIPDHMLSQHRHCIDAAGPRIKNGCNNIAELPEGRKADSLYERRMQELAEEVVEIGKFSDVKLDWNLFLYNLQPLLPTVNPPASAGVGEGPGAGGVVPRPANSVVLNVEVGEFVALPTPPSAGKVLSTAPGEGGDELTLHWYMPARVTDKCVRSEYGEGRWTEEYLMEGGRRVAFIGSESVAAFSSKFLSLTKQGKMPKHVWASVAESTLPGA